MNASAPYTETLLHWLWKNRHLQHDHLSTRSGRKVVIHHPGYPNASDGPDFLNARITIGELQWHGDIEIHWTSRDWYSHTHHTDPNYNRVILHVVFHDRQTVTVQRQDGTAIPTLYIRPFLDHSLQYFFRHYRHAGGLPCAGHAGTIPASVFEEQIARAHRQYFEQKVDDLLVFYPPGDPLSAAWKNMLATGLFDGLGIRHNRRPMRVLCRRLMTEEPEELSADSLARKALRIAGLDPTDPARPFRWKRKGSRPANHPEPRVRQGCQMLFFIQKTPLSWWLRTDVSQSFSDMLHSIGSSPCPGARRAGVLRGTVWLPALYILGDLTATRRLTSEARKYWSEHQTTLPSAIRRPFEKAGIPESCYRQKLGAVHQYRHYCRPHRCQMCKVFKTIISS